MTNDFYTTNVQFAVADMAVEVRDYAYPEPFEGTIKRARHTLSFSLSSRVAYSQCAYLDEQQRAVAWIDVGDVIFAPAGVVMRGRGSGGNQRRLVCSFDPGAFARLTGHDEVWSESEIVAGLNIQSPSVKSDLYRLSNELAELGEGRAIVLEAMGKILAVETVRYIRQVQQPTPVRGALAQWQIRRITAYVESMIEPVPSVERLAQLCDLSARHLQRAFKATMGRTVGDYVKAIRLIKAKSLLIDTTLAQKEIAYRLGFSNPTSFGVAFSKATGMTPGQFRDRKK